jgi:hypothetical protein
MEIKELVSYYFNETTQTLDITFRLTNDSEDEIRADQIELSEIKTFGYDFNNKSGNYDEYYNEMLDDEFGNEFDDEYDDINEDDIISFLNEYYIINPSNLPKPDFF